MSKEPRTTIRKSITIGPVVVDGFLIGETGEFRQGMRSTGRAIGVNHQRVSLIVSTLPTAGANALQGNESHGFPQAKPATRTNVPVLRLPGRPESLLNLWTVQKVWAHEARYGGGPSQDMAWELINILAGVSLERSYQEAFGVADSRNQSDRLLDFFINWNIGPYAVLFDTSYQIQFKRVTGHEVNSKSQHVAAIHANFLYNRLPAEVYECVLTLNPVTETGRRAHKHHQFFTDDAKLAAVRPIIVALKACMMQATGPRQVNELMDRLYPTQRGSRVKTSAARHNQLNLV